MLLLSGLLSGLLTYYAQGHQFFPEILPIFPDFFPDRYLLPFFFFSWFSLAILLYASGKLTLLLSGILTYYAQSQNFFPDLLPNLLPNRNLLNVFLFFWLSFASLRFIYNRCCSSSSDEDSSVNKCKYSHVNSFNGSKMLQSLLLGGLLGVLLTYFAQGKQFFPEILPIFPDFFPDRTLLNFFLFSCFSLAILLYASGKLTLLLSGILTYYAQSQNFFPDLLPNLFPNRNLLNVFLFFWLSFASLRFIYNRCCSSSNDDVNEYKYSPINSYYFNSYDDDYDDYDYRHARNNIAHRADAFNPLSGRFNPSSQNGGGGRTARWSHGRASQNNKIVRYWV